MTWYKDILHLFTRLSEQSFQNIINYGSHTRAILNLVVSTIVLYRKRDDTMRIRPQVLFSQRSKLGNPLSHRMKGRGLFNLPIFLSILIFLSFYLFQWHKSELPPRYATGPGSPSLTTVLLRDHLALRSLLWYAAKMNTNSVTLPFLLVV